MWAYNSLLLGALPPAVVFAVSAVSNYSPRSSEGVQYNLGIIGRTILVQYFLHAVMDLIVCQYGWRRVRLLSISFGLLY